LTIVDAIGSALGAAVVDAIGSTLGAAVVAAVVVGSTFIR
jgi:hypothetical protein